MVSSGSDGWGTAGTHDGPHRKLRDGVDAFTATDTAAWSAILAAERIPDGATMLRESAEDPDRRRVLQDCSAVDRLLARFCALG